MRWEIEYDDERGGSRWVQVKRDGKPESRIAALNLSVEAGGVGKLTVTYILAGNEYDSAGNKIP